MAENPPSVDVGVVTYNSRDLSVEALRRLLDTPSSCKLRLLVRDNGSSDGTAEPIAARVPEAELEAGGDNPRFAAGVKSLICRPDGPWVFAANSDTRPRGRFSDPTLQTGAAHAGA